VSEDKNDEEKFSEKTSGADIWSEIYLQMLFSEY
jgi:hypothetical protein